MPTMMRKNDLIVWLFMSETQLKIYKDFLELDSVKEVSFTLLRKIDFEIFLENLWKF